MNNASSTVNNQYFVIKNIIKVFQSGDKREISRLIEKHGSVDIIYLKLFFENHSNYIKYKKENYTYKNRNLYQFFSNLLDYKMSKDFIDKNYYDIYYKLINELFGVQNGFNLIYKMDLDIVHYMKTCQNVYFIDIFKKCARIGTYGNFMILYNSSDIIKLYHYDIFIQSCLNTDDRIFSFLLTKLDQENDIQQVFKTIIHAKYKDRIKLKRIKIVYDKFKCEPKDILSLVSTLDTFNLCIKILQFYNKNRINETHYNWVTYLIKKNNNNKSDFMSCIKMIEKEKIIDFLIECVIVCKTIFGFDYYKYLENYNNKNIMSLISKIDMSISFTILNNDNLYDKNYYYFLCDVVDKCSKNPDFESKIVKNYKNKREYLFYVPFTKYMQANRNDSIIILLNRRLFYLKTFIKKKSKQVIAKRKVNHLKLMDEILNYEPNENIKVLSRGSLNYRLRKQRYNVLEPKKIKLESLIGDKFIVRRKTENTITDIIDNINYKMTYYNNKFMAIDYYSLNDDFYNKDLLVDRKNLLLENGGHKKMKMVNSREQLISELEKEDDNITKSDRKYKIMKSWLVNRELLGDIKDLVIITPVDYNRDYILM